MTTKAFRRLKYLLTYSDRYEISIQFWPEQVAIYLAKDDCDLNSWGDTTGEIAIEQAIEYLDRINRVKL